MKTFTDNLGRSWTITIDVSAIKRVRSLLDVNILDVAGGDLLQRVIEDPVLLCDVIYCLVKPDADAREVSDEDFGRSMAGDAIELATTAFLEELADFFPRDRRDLLRKGMSKIQETKMKLITAAEARLDSPELEERLQEMIAGSLSGNSPESSESTPPA